MKIARLVLFVALAALPTGCIPMPNRHYFAPRVSGTLTNAGSPVSGAEIRLSARFTKDIAVSVTDADGRFSLGPLTEIEFTTMLIGDPLYSYDLIIKAEGREYPGYSYGSIGYASQPVSVVCDLSQPVPTRTRDPKYRDIKYCAPKRAAGENANEVSLLKWLDNADPERDARSALEKHDFRLRAVYVFTLTVPGVDTSSYGQYEKKYGFNR